MSIKKKHKKNIALCSVLILGLSLRLYYLFTRPFPMEADKLNTFYPDESVYYSFANLLKEEGIIRGFLQEQSLWVAPLNSIYIYLTIDVLGMSIFLLRILNILISTFCIFLIYKIGANYKNQKVGLLAAVVVAIYLPIIDLSPTILTEPIYIFLLLLGLNYFILGFKNDNYKQMITSGVFLALATLTRSVLLLFPIFVIMICLYSYYKRKKTFTNLFVFTIIFFLVLSPFMIKNYLVFDQFTISNGSGAALYLGSRSDTEGDEPPYRGKDYDTGRIAAPYSHLESEGDNLLKKAAIENIKEHPFSYLYWDFKKIGRLLVGNQYYWSYPSNSIIDYIKIGNISDGLIKILNMLIAISVSVIGGYQLIKKIFVKRSKFLNPLIFFIVYLLGISLPFLANHRYGLPILILMSVMFASYFFDKQEYTDA